MRKPLRTIREELSRLSKQRQNQEEKATMQGEIHHLHSATPRTGTLVEAKVRRERKQAERLLEVERDMLHNLMANLPDGIYFKDLEHRYVRLKGNRNCRDRYAQY